jgi:hypothetical protein
MRLTSHSHPCVNMSLLQHSFYHSGHSHPYRILHCHNPSFGFMTKTRACKGANQEGSPGVTFHAPWSVGECKGMNPHTPKWAPTLGVGIQMDSWIFKKKLQGSKPIELKNSLYHWNVLGTEMSKMGSHDPFGHFKHKLWPKEGLGVKLAI